MGRWGDGETERRGDGETGRRGDGEMGRLGDGEMGRRGDGEMGRRGDKAFRLTKKRRIKIRLSIYLLTCLVISEYLNQ